MSPPPFLLGTALVFWGWRLGLTWLGVLMAVGLELPRLSRRRLALTLEDFRQLWHVTLLLLLVLLVWLFNQEDGLNALNQLWSADSMSERRRAMDRSVTVLLQFILWSPVALFPLLAAHLASGLGPIEWTMLFPQAGPKGWKRPSDAGLPSARFHPGYLYLGLVLLAASTRNAQPWTLFFGTSVLVGWALWPWRNRRFALPVWVGSWLAAVAVGYVSLQGLYQLQRLFDAWQGRWLMGGAKNFDPQETRTAMGRIARLKGSGRIVLRIEVPPGQPPPGLLRQATYSVFHSPGTWTESARSFSPVLAETNAETTWVFARRPAPRSVTIATYLDRGAGVLNLPAGATRVDRLQVFQVETNRAGTVRVGLGAKFVHYTATYDPAFSWDGPPRPEDVDVPAPEQPVFARVAGELNLGRLNTSEKVQAVMSCLGTNCRYSLDLKRPSPGSGLTPLGWFLREGRQGHCEYFAGAAVLLLRQAGVPARYAAGYAVQETAGLNHYVARERHAHAWCRYFDPADGLWRDLDATPGGWFEAEAKNRSFWEPLRDCFSWLSFAFSRLRHGEFPFRRYLLYGLAAVLGWLVFRFAVQKRWGKNRPPAPVARSSPARVGLGVFPG